MINWILDNLPVFINIDCKNSKTIDLLILSPINGVAITKMSSGSVHGFPVRRIDMLRINQYESVGKWLEDCIVR